jgi:dihydrofolate synthase/folylpolyglutamate synthase
LKPGFVSQDDEYQNFLRRLDEQNQFVINYDPRAMRRALELDGTSRSPATVNILVGGTNGKGSTAAYLNALCCAAGLTTALYTSPHLTSFRERMRIDGVPIAQTEVVDYGGDLFERYGDEEHAEDVRCLTYFELTTLLALRWFGDRDDLDVAIFEVGLGGRMDATNAIDVDISCFCSISMEHQDYLGDSLEAIAKEKAGIAREGRPAYVHVGNNGVKQLLPALEEKGADVRLVEPTKPDLVGLHPHQSAEPLKRNRELASAAFLHIAETLVLEDHQTRSALRKAPKLVRWPGRQDVVVAGKRRYLVDGAHNHEALDATARWLNRILGEEAQVPVVFGVSGSRSLPNLLVKLLPWAERVLLPNHVASSVFSDGVADRELLAECRKLRPELDVRTYSSVADAFSSLQSAGDCIVAGSLYLVGDAYAALGYGEENLPDVLNRDLLK